MTVRNSTVGSWLVLLLPLATAAAFYSPTSPQAVPGATSRPAVKGGPVVATNSAPTQPASAASGRLLPVGSPAPKFAATSLSGEAIQFPDDFRGQLVLLHFWASWCPSCARDFPAWVRANEQFNGLGLTILGVSVDRNREIGSGEVLAELTQRGGTWEVIYQDATISKQLSRYPVPSLPTLYLIDGDTGRIVAAGDDLRRGRLLKTLEKHLAAKFPELFPASESAQSATPASQPTGSRP